MVSSTLSAALCKETLAKLYWPGLFIPRPFQTKQFRAFFIGFPSLSSHLMPSRLTLSAIDNPPEKSIGSSSSAELLALAIWCSVLRAARRVSSSLTTRSAFAIAASASSRARLASSIAVVSCSSVTSLDDCACGSACACAAVGAHEADTSNAKASLDIILPPGKTRHPDDPVISTIKLTRKHYSRG